MMLRPQIRKLRKTGFKAQIRIPTLKYILDKLGGATATGCVYAKSLYKLSKAYTGYCLQVQRQSDNAVLDIGFKSGYVNIAAIETFCAGTNGRMKIRYDQVGGNNEIQTTFSNMPIICTAGVFDVNGVKFSSGSTSYTNVVDYAGIQIINPPLSIYINHSPITSSTGYIITKNNLNSDIQYGVLNEGNLLKFYLNTASRASASQNATSNNKSLLKWQTEANSLNLNVNGTVTNATYATAPLTNIGYFIVGARYNTYPLRALYTNSYINTVLIFNTNQLNSYSLIANKC